MIREEFAGSEDDELGLQTALGSEQGRQYQAAFRYLQGTRGQSVSMPAEAIDPLACASTGRFREESGIWTRELCRRYSMSCSPPLRP
jgi:hypothetical protein